MPVIKRHINTKYLLTKSQAKQTSNLLTDLLIQVRLLVVRLHTMMTEWEGK